MKKSNPSVKAQILRSAFYLLLFLGICAIPFALAQWSFTNLIKTTDAGVFVWFSEIRVYSLNSWADHLASFISLIFRWSVRRLIPSFLAAAVVTMIAC
jgi:hypothetical protein